MNDKKKGTPAYNRMQTELIETKEAALHFRKVYEKERHFNMSLQKENTKLLIRMSPKSFVLGFLSAALLCGTAFSIYWYNLV